MLDHGLRELKEALTGELHTDELMRVLYATDASAYSEMPLAVAIPENEADLKKLIAFANTYKTSLIPRTAGTSLAGQVVGKGVVVDVSKYFTEIIEVNTAEKWVRVQPGVVRDELNRYLRPYGLYFGPETSTANRAMIGGMVGNNACGSNSLVYGSTRDHTLEVKALLSDGSEAVFRPMNFDEFIAAGEGDTLEASLYRTIRQQLGDWETQQEIRREFPKESVNRRNTGYAVDVLVNSNPFTAGGGDFNFCKLLCGSEGTLAFITEIKLNLEELPPQITGLLCVHCPSVDAALHANIIALNYQPRSCELIDHYILDCTLDNPSQALNRFFVQGSPKAILVVELSAKSDDELIAIAARLEDELRQGGLGYHFPLLTGKQQNAVWSLRKAGLGLLSNLPGDEKAVAVIEDTAVDALDLPAYIAEFNQILAKHGLYSVYYAHAGSGELHLRPMLNLKTADGVKKFRIIAQEIAGLVKKYRGSLSGEHGDGRLRGEFIPQMIGEKNYRLLQAIKQTWDPQGIFNPGKITGTPPMDEHLRYTPGQQVPEIKTVFRFRGQNILQHAEQCNGSGDCRKSAQAGGTMCPSYMATRNEQDTTRARANTLRHYLTNSEKLNRFDHPEIKEVMDLCLSCKGCRSECPSSVDMAKLKAEFLQHYYDANGTPMQAKLIAALPKLNKLGMAWPGLYNFFTADNAIGNALKKSLGFSAKRNLPKLAPQTLRQWYKKQVDKKQQGKRVYLFCDEFTNYNDVNIGQKAIKLLKALGYNVIIPQHLESARTMLSKGLLRQAKAVAEKNVELLAPLISEDTPLIGIEPSAILSFRDEYPDLVREELLPQAQQLAQHALLFEEFIAREARSGNITSDQFTTEHRQILLHGHCQQKAWNVQSASQTALSLPANYQVEVIPSGCCGMAGSFGYEDKHYDVSMRIGELVLFPAVRNAEAGCIIAAPGTSCRHQIKDGTAVTAQHPAEILWDALVKTDAVN
ncbi:FAD-linked oxidase C-terminal domain-containing protein [Mucilaginibacter defluvii]|uniref:FAD-binding and (Fe-S)-binding domain-containing protein n=1 Tax=Mucilaginibacter defluvii TaxID=1196019 RepID=A0ABP9FKR9_9SPHI